MHEDFLCTYVCSFFNIQQLKCAISPNFSIANQYSATTTAPIFEYMALVRKLRASRIFQSKPHRKPLGIACKAGRTLYIRPTYGKLLNIEQTNGFCLVQSAIISYTGSNKIYILYFHSYWTRSFLFLLANINNVCIQGATNGNFKQEMKNVWKLVHFLRNFKG